MVFRTYRIGIILNMEGCMNSTQQQLGNWKPSKHFLVDREKPRKPVSRWLVVGYCG
jgi:hypothetical protein